MSASNFRLRVTAGPTYDRATHTAVPVNTSTPLTISTPHSTTTLHIRLSSFRSSPTHPLPSTHSYFTHPSHTTDLYSIQLTFSPTTDINGTDLVWGNDFDKPIRNLLPTGFSLFWNLAKWVDPGLDGDLYSDTPWVYGHVLSSMNIISVTAPGNLTPPETELDDNPHQTEIPTEHYDSGDTVLTEDMTAVSTHSATIKIPETPAARKKFFLEDENRTKVVFTKGWRYGLDFFGPWLDFANFEIKLPGYGLNLLRYWDGQPVRYVLKNKKTDDVYACVLLDFIEVGSEQEEKERAKGALVEDDID